MVPPEQSQIDMAFNLAEHIAVRVYIVYALVRDLLKLRAKPPFPDTASQGPSLVSGLNQPSSAWKRAHSGSHPSND